MDILVSQTTWRARTCRALFPELDPIAPGGRRRSGQFHFGRVSNGRLIFRRRVPIFTTLLNLKIYHRCGGGSGRPWERASDRLLFGKISVCLIRCWERCSKGILNPLCRPLPSTQCRPLSCFAP